MIETDENFEFKDENPLLHLDLYEGYFSSHWESDMGAAEFISLCSDLGAEGTEPCILCTETSDKNEKLAFDELKRKIKMDETVPTFIRVDFEQVAVTWEDDIDETTRIGYISEETEPEDLNRVYTDTTNSSISGETWTRLTEKIS